jgi:hypothetical protein
MTLSGHRRFAMLRRNDQAKHGRAANAAPDAVPQLFTVREVLKS